MKSGIERRKFRRTALQDSFSFFIVIPKVQGMSRIYMRDLSRSGLCFKVEAEVEIDVGENFDIQFYTSPAFFLKLACRVVRVDGENIAVEFKDPESKAAQAIGKLQEFIELAADAV